MNTITHATPDLRLADKLAIAGLIIAYGFGDTLTTIVALSLGGFESNETVATAISDHGLLLGTIGMKVVALAALVLLIVTVWIVVDLATDQLDTDLPDPVPFAAKYMLPFYLTAHGLWLVAHNTVTIVQLL